MQIRGEGGPLAPALVIPIDLDLYLLGDQRLILERLSATLWTYGTPGPRVRIGSPATLETIGSDRGPVQSSPQGAGPDRLEMRFDLQTGALRQLDEHVRVSPGNVVQLALTFETRIGWARKILNDEPNVHFGTLLEILPFWRTVTEELQVQLPRERWVRDVAPALGHDQIRLIAVEMPNSTGPLGSDLVASFDAATRAYDASHWRDCVQNCRDARHQVEQHICSAEIKYVSQAVAQLAGVEDDDPRIKFLSETWKALVDITNHAKHIESMGRLDAATAHAVLLLTATMIQYLSELLSPA